MNTKSGDNAKLIIMGILLMIGLVTMFNAVPVIILLAGAYLAKRGRDPDTIRTTTRTVQGLYVIVALLLMIAVIYNIPEAMGPDDPDGYNYARDQAFENIVVLFSFMVGILTLIGLLSGLWMGPMMRRIAVIPNDAATDTGPSIMKRDSLASYSVADELRKWRDLRDDGTVSEDEFKAARARILNETRTD